MVTNVQIVSEEKSVKTLEATYAGKSHVGFPVVNSKGKLSGIVTLSEVPLQKISE